ncbi:hypothetical protein STENM223S_04243 [Streptomyces tendae]
MMRRRPGSVTAAARGGAGATPSAKAVRRGAGGEALFRLPGAVGAVMGAGADGWGGIAGSVGGAPVFGVCVIDLPVVILRGKYRRRARHPHRP